MSVDLTPSGPPFTVHEAAPLLNCSVDLVYDGVARGEIRALRLGRAIRIPRAEIARLLGLDTRGAPGLAKCDATGSTPL